MDWMELGINPNNTLDESDTFSYAFFAVVKLIPYDGHRR